MSSDEVQETEVVAPPKKVFGGRFSVYLTEDERVVLAWQIDGTEETEHKVLPKALLAALGRFSGLPVDPLELLRQAAAGGD